MANNYPIQVGSRFKNRANQYIRLVQFGTAETFDGTFRTRVKMFYEIYNVTDWWWLDYLKGYLATGHLILET